MIIKYKVYSLNIKYILFWILTTLLFFSILKAEYYSIKRDPHLLDVGDLDLDGDMDIIVVHKISINDATDNPTMTILLNDGFGYFTEIYELDMLVDGSSDDCLLITNIDDNPLPDIFTIAGDTATMNVRYLATIMNFDLDDWTLENLYSVNYDTIDYLYYYRNLLDIDFDGDGDKDIVLAAENHATDNDSFLVFINDNGSLIPHNNYWSPGSNPGAADVGDINDDGYEDIIAGSRSNPPIYGWAYLGSQNGFSISTNVPSFHYRVNLYDMDMDQDLDINCMRSFSGQLSGFRRFWRYENEGLMNFTQHTFFEGYYGYLIIEAGRLSPLGPGLVFNIGYDGFDSIAVHLNNGLDSTVFESKYYGVAPEGLHEGNGGVYDLVVQDINNDSWDDIIIIVDNAGYIPGGVRVLYNNGLGHFSNEPNDNTALVEELNGISIQLNVFPNPFNNESILSYDLNPEITGYINMYDLLGRHIKSIHLTQSTGTYKLNTESLNSGIYFLELVTNHQRITKKIGVLK